MNLPGILAHLAEREGETARDSLIRNRVEDLERETEQNETRAARLAQGFGTLVAAFAEAGA